MLYKHTLSLCDKILASFPGLHAQLLSLAVGKVGGRPGRIYHVMCAAARHPIQVEMNKKWACNALQGENTLTTERSG